MIKLSRCRMVDVRLRNQDWHLLLVALHSAGRVLSVGICRVAPTRTVDTVTAEAFGHCRPCSLPRFPSPPPKGPRCTCDQYDAEGDADAYACGCAGAETGAA